jgi:hypothetical protein
MIRRSSGRPEHSSSSSTPKSVTRVSSLRSKCASGAERAGYQVAEVTARVGRSSCIAESRRGRCRSDEHWCRSPSSIRRIEPSPLPRTAQTVGGMPVVVEAEKNLTVVRTQGQGRSGEAQHHRCGRRSSPALAANGAVDFRRSNAEIEELFDEPTSTGHSEGASWRRRRTRDAASARAPLLPALVPVDQAPLCLLVLQREVTPESRRLVDACAVPPASPAGVRGAIPSNLLLRPVLERALRVQRQRHARVLAQERLRLPDYPHQKPLS